jgi:hypothetical protein
VPKDKAPKNPFEIWDGCFDLHTMIDICNNCSLKNMLKIFVGGVGLNKPSLEASLEEQTITFKGLEGKKI